MFTEELNLTLIYAQMENPIMAEINIRLANETDAVPIAQILRATGWFAFLDKEPFDETESRVRRHIYLCRADDSHTIYVADNVNVGVVGYVSVHWLPTLFLLGPEGYLSELFVDQSHRGHGLGKRLLDAVVNEGKNRGCSRLMLITSQSRESYKRRFYSQVGWLERDEMSNFVLQL